MTEGHHHSIAGGICYCDKPPTLPTLKALQQEKIALHRLVSRWALRKMRTQMGLTQSAMAEYIGAGAKSYTRWENGAKPSRMTMRLLHALDELRVIRGVIRAWEIYHLQRTKENFAGVEKAMADYDNWRVKVG